VPLARALADAADFSYSFVPNPDESMFTLWSPCDVRDGRVLLSCKHWSLRTTPTIFREVLAVCDPLSRRYVLLPPFPLNMDMTLQQEYCGFRPILTAIGHDDGDETSFRVLCWVNYQSKFFMLVFSSTAGNWRIAACHSWSSFGTVAETSEIMLYFSCVRGRLYVLDGTLLEQAACVGHLHDGVFRCRHPHQLPYAAYKSPRAEDMVVFFCSSYRRSS
jgi:hypothetical protein